ncbi:MAG: hypothetical protein V4594_16710 [Bacteroidota bacterium]
MKNIERVVWAFVIVILTFMLFKKCKNDPGLVTVKTETITTIDTIPGEIVYVPQPYAVHDSFIESFAVEVEVPKPYPVPVAAKKEPVQISLYNDTLKLDSSGYAVVKDTVQGKILGRSFSYKLFHPTVTTTNTVDQKKKIRGYIGAEYFYPMNYTGGAIALQLKNDNFLKLSAGHANGSAHYGISYFAKIKFK